MSWPANAGNYWKNLSWLCGEQDQPKLEHKHRNNIAWRSCEQTSGQTLCSQSVATFDVSINGLVKAGLIASVSDKSLKRFASVRNPYIDCVVQKWEPNQIDVFLHKTLHEPRAWVLNDTKGHRAHTHHPGKTTLFPWGTKETESEIKQNARQSESPD